jgi:hypothetical protein
VADDHGLGSWQRVDMILRLQAPTGRKLLLVAIARQESRRHGVCYASMGTLAKEASLSRRWVWRELVALDAEGLIKTDRQNGRAPRVEICWERVQEIVEAAETRGASSQVEYVPFADSEDTCDVNSQVGNETRALGSQVEAKGHQTSELSAQGATADVHADCTCEVTPSNLRSRTARPVKSPVNSGRQTWEVSSHKGFEEFKGDEGNGRAASRDSIALGCRYPQPQTPLETPPVEETADEREPLLPGSTLTASEIEARRRFVEQMRPAWARRAG